MTTKYRPPDWVNPYGKPRMGKKASRWYELGADAMLQSLRAMGEIVMDAETGINRLNVVIPDDPLDPQPVSKTDEFKQPTYTLTCEECGDAFYSREAFPKPQLCPFCGNGSIPEKPDNSKEQLMICKMSDACKSTSGNCFNAKPHKHDIACDYKGACDVCVPYIEPEQEKETDWENVWAFFKDNKASKVVERGYFCEHCFRTISKGNYCGCYFSLEELK